MYSSLNISTLFFQEYNIIKVEFRSKAYNAEAGTLQQATLYMAFP
jgi:hypothetical protein